MPRAPKTQAAPAPAKKKRGPKPFTQPKPVAIDKPQRHARRDLPPIARAVEVEYPLVFQNRNRHPRNGQRCRECPTVAAPENMIALRFADGTNLIALRRDVSSLDNQAGTEPDRKFWGTR